MPGPLTSMPGTMLLIVNVLPVQSVAPEAKPTLVMFLLPLDAVPFTLLMKSGLLFSAVVGVVDDDKVSDDPLMLPTVSPLGNKAQLVSAVEVQPAINIPTEIPPVLERLVTVVFPVVQVPVTVTAVGPITPIWALGVTLAGGGPIASEAPVCVRVAFDEGLADMVIDELLTLLTVALLGMPGPYIYIPGWMAAVPETEPFGVSIETLEIVLLPLVVFPMIGVTGIMLPRKSVNLPLVVVM
jgi:hypothetical protein